MHREKGTLNLDIQLAFIGKVLSVFTHEMNNHLAIINETSGLLGDMVEFGLESDKEGILRTVYDVQGQVKESSRIVSMLNRFGHRMDNPSSIFNVNDCLEELTALINRMAAQKRIAFELKLSGALPTVQSSPQALQLLIYGVIMFVMENLAENSVIVLQTELKGNAVIVSCAAGANMAEDCRCTASLEKMYAPAIDTLQATIKSAEGTILIIIPVSQAPQAGGYV